MQPQPGAQQYAEQPAGSMRQPAAVPMTTLVFCFKGFVYVLVSLLLFVGFILQLSGVGSAHDDCEDDDLWDMDCKEFFRRFWWTTFFELLVVVAVGVIIFVDVVKDTRVAAVAFLAIATLQLITRTEDSLEWRKDYRTDEDDYRTAAAGYILSATANFILLIVLGVKKTPSPVMPAFMANAMQQQARAAQGGLPEAPPVYYPRVGPQPVPAPVYAAH